MLGNDNEKIGYRVVRSDKKSVQISHHIGGTFYHKMNHKKD